MGKRPRKMRRPLAATSRLFKVPAIEKYVVHINATPEFLNDEKSMSMLNEMVRLAAKIK